MIVKSKHTEKHMSKNLEVVLVEEEKRCKLNPDWDDCRTCCYKVGCKDVAEWSQLITERKKEAAEATSNETLVNASGLVETTVVPSNKYLADFFDKEKIRELIWGQASFICTQTGSGKSYALENITFDLSGEYYVLVLSPRLCNDLQFLKELAEKMGVPIETLKELQKHMRVTITTYQSFVGRESEFTDKKLIVICDEVHCLSEDATFSSYPQRVIRWLKNNRDRTIRIYVTGTPADIAPLLWDLEFEPKEGSLYQPLTSKGILNASSKDVVTHRLGQHTRIQHLYLMKSDYNYITFKTYDNLQQLADFTNKNSADGHKTLMLINDIDKGREFNALLNPPGQQIYSDSLNDELNEEIEKITMNSCFDSSVLITTKVANNGLSIHDDKVTIIVAHSYDPIAIQQIIGRVRVNRKNPRNITVLIPDYNSGDLGRIEHMLCEQLNKFKKAKANPYAFDCEPYRYSSPEGRILVPNELAIKTLEIKLKFIQKLKAEEQENPHAFVRYILSLYGKGNVYSDKLRIDYDAIIDCKSRIQEAAKVFEKSDGSAAALDKLRDGLRAAFEATGTDFKRRNSKKAFDLSTNFQINTINDILEYGEVERPVQQRYIMCDKEPIE
ncbi:MAG: DEAD/DEAH box helicase family protein [Ruminococcus sp.]|uniref:DEAD/DEAH box helicase n=1 Tax=Ruminococcus sp. TaxID=41978 RepID=UPI0025D7C61C|nr:DEAD/DEAH box helicase family protein [Ruminococcus sp.]MCR5599243.1 DEAD/DEAH box helicase family protein [Ruminococcus sp.]